MRYLIINEHGDLFFENFESPIKTVEVIQELFKNMHLTEQFLLETEYDNERFIVESFDQPLFAHKLEVTADHKVFIHTQSQQIFEAVLNKFSLDYRDRICGITTHNLPFCLTEKAQSILFDQCDEFDDDSFTLNNLKIETPQYFFENSDIEKPEFWTAIYKQPQQPGWDLGQPAETLKDMLPRLKLPKCRILVLGCGEGHDAALFAQAGHVVTAVDFSSESIKKAKSKYSHLNIDWVQQDIFQLPHEWNGTFDVIVEHTCFCAINPDHRKEMAKLWRRLLHEEGQLLATFYTMFKRSGPPYGCTEFEIRDLLQKDFQFLFWGRWRKSIERRQGRELFVLAKKK